MFRPGHTLAHWIWNNLIATARRAMNGRAYRGILIVGGLFVAGLSLHFVSCGINFFRS